MNRRIRWLGVFVVFCFLAVFVKLNQVQVFQADELNDHPLNARKTQQEYNRPRGTITSADGALLAQSVDTPPDSPFERIRVYPEGALFGQITGYFSFLFGSAGAEKYYDDVLTGQTFGLQVRGLRDLLVSDSSVGSITVSVRKDIQETARQELGDREGSVVALDPRTGELLGFWSFPSFDPNLVSGDKDAQMRTNWALLNLAPGKPLQPHQYQERYFPGSTFKVVTAGVGLQTGKVTDTNPVYPFATSYLPPQTNRPISNFGGESCGGTLPQILRISCNSAFAEMGQATIGGPDMVKGTESFGFNDAPPIDLPNPSKSLFPEDVVGNPPKLAQSSIGQNDVAATPLQMALVAAAVANKGSIMTPHVLKEVRDSQLNVVQRYDPKEWKRPLNPEHAAQLRADMVGVVTSGTGTAARLPGYEVGGKTGTAQLGDGRLHTWFIAFAGPPGGDPTVAVAVVVLNVPNTGNEATGGVIAAPIARDVMRKVLEVQRVPPSGR